MIQRHDYVLAVPEFARSSAFYRDVLGFAIHDLDEPGWMVYEKDGCRIMAGECPDAIRRPGTSAITRTSRYLAVDDVEAYHARAVAAGATVNGSRSATSPGACASSACAPPTGIGS